MSVRIWCLERSDNQNFRFLSSEMFRQHCDNLQQHIRAKQLPKDVTAIALQTLQLEMMLKLDTYCARLVK